LTTQGLATASEGPTGTSVERPRTVEVMGPTITECRIWPQRISGQDHHGSGLVEMGQPHVSRRGNGVSPPGMLVVESYPVGVIRQVTPIDAELGVGNVLI
jgi:hypothetical protein